MRLEAIAPTAVADGAQGHFALIAVVGSPILHPSLHEAEPAAVLRPLAVPRLGVLNRKVCGRCFVGKRVGHDCMSFRDTRGYLLVTQPVSQQGVGHLISKVHDCAVVQAVVSAHVVADGLPAVGDDHAEEGGVEPEPTVLRLPAVLQPKV